MAVRSAKIDQKADLIWAIADKLSGVYKPHEYGEVILPLTVIRRFDCILSDTKDAVLAKYEEVKNLPMKDVLLRRASGYDFYNTSKYTFERLIADPDNIEANFRDYLNGFSENVRDIIEKFKFDGHVTTMFNSCISLNELDVSGFDTHYSRRVKLCDPKLKMFPPWRGIRKAVPDGAAFCRLLSIRSLSW